MKKMVSVVLMFFILSGIICVPVGAEDTVIAISTPEDLMSIKSDGVYEIVNDIDCSGITCAPVRANNVTIYGNGYTVSNMSFYDDVIGQYEDNDEVIYSAFGFIDGWDCVIYDTIFENITLEGTLHGYGYSYPYCSLLGKAKAVGCQIYGSIDVSVIGYDNELSFLNGEDSYTDIDVSIKNIQEDSYITVYGMTRNTNCRADVRFKGYGDNIKLYGIHYSTDCDLTMDTSFEELPGQEDASPEMIGMQKCTDCSLSGSISSDVEYMEFTGASGSASCYIASDLVISASRRINAYMFRDYCTNCHMDGDAEFEVTRGGISYCKNHSKISVIVYDLDCKDCIFNGDMTASGEKWCQVEVTPFGTRSSSCVYNGNITGVSQNGLAVIDLQGENCVYAGDIIAKITEESKVYCTVCSIYHEKGAYIWNYSDSTDVYGTLTAIYADKTISCGAGQCVTVFDCCGSSNIYPYSSLSDSVPHSCQTDSFISGISRAYISCLPNSKNEEERDNTYVLKVADEVSGAPVADAEIVVDGNTFTTDQNGVAVVKGKQVIKDFTVLSKGEELYSKEYYVPNGDVVNNLLVSSFDLTPNDLEFANADTLQLKGPEMNIGGMKFPIFDVPMDFDLNFFDTVKTAYDSESRTFKVLFGDSSEFGNLRKGRYTPSFKRKFQEAEQFFNAVKKNAGKPWLFRHYLKPNLQKDVSLMGYIEIGVNNEGKTTVLDGGAVLTLSRTFSGGMPLPAAPYLYYAYSISGDVSGKLNCTPTGLPDGEPPIAVSGTVTGSFSPSIGAGLGWKGMVGAEAGIAGQLSGEFSFPFRSFSESFKAKLDAEYYFLFYLLGMEEKVKHTFMNFDLYPQMENLELMNLEQIEKNLKPVEQRKINALYGQVEDENTVVSDLYPYSSVQTAVLSEGKTLMVWLDYDTERTKRNQSALYSCVIENGVRGEMIQVHNDGTADFTFDLSGDGQSGKAGIVWQNAKTSLTDDATLEDTAKSVELSYACFDGNSWSSPVSVTGNNTDYEYSPVLTYSWNNSTIAWVQNDKNAPIPGLENTNETVYSMNNVYGELGEKTIAFEGLPLVCELEAGTDGMVACIADKDGDVQTNQDTVLYTTGGTEYEGKSRLSGLTYAPQRGYGYCYFSEGSYLKEVILYENQINTVIEITGGQNFRRIEGDSPVVIYEAQEGFTSNLYGYYLFEKDIPVQITDFDGRIRSWDAYFDEKGNLKIAVVLADVSSNGDDIINTAKLILKDAKPSAEDIALAGIWTDESTAPGSRATFQLAVDNNTSCGLSSLYVTLNHDICGTLYEGELDVNIPAGQSDTAEVYCVLPDNFEKGNIRAEISSEKVTEDNTENNSVSEQFGNADLGIIITGRQVAKKGELTLIASNHGAERADGVFINLSGENGDVIFTKEIGSLAGGESKAYSVTLPQEYYTFGHSYQGFSVFAEITSDIEDPTEYNNKDAYRIKCEKEFSLRTEPKSTVLETGKTYQPAFLKNDTMYAVSENEAVATVSKDGTITAKGLGTTVISFFSADSVQPMKITVHVRSMGIPKITDVTYQEDYVTVVADTADCLAEDETRMFILAAYNEQNALIGIKTEAVTGKGEKRIRCYSEKKPYRIKLMLWDSYLSLNPFSHAVEKLLD